MTGDQHAAASLPAASRIVVRAPAERSRNTPWGRWARPTCRPEACRDFAAWAAFAVAARADGWACPRASQPGSSRRPRSRFRRTALARLGMPEKTGVSKQLTVSAAATAYLDEVLPLGLGDKWLQLRGRKGVDKTCL
jgi:hypothetical protein